MSSPVRQGFRAHQADRGPRGPGRTRLVEDEGQPGHAWTDAKREGRVPAGGHVVSHLTLAVLTEVLVIVRTGGGAVHKLLPFPRLEHSWKNR